MLLINLSWSRIGSIANYQYRLHNLCLLNEFLLSNVLVIDPILISEGTNTSIYPDFGTVTEGVIVNTKLTVDSSAECVPNPVGFAKDDAFY